MPDRNTELIREAQAQITETRGMVLELRASAHTSETRINTIASVSNSLQDQILNLDARLNSLIEIMRTCALENDLVVGDGEPLDSYLAQFTIY